MNDNTKENMKIDSLGLTLMFSQLRMPAIKNTWERFAEQADREGWPAGRLLWVLAELELAERDRRRIQRHLSEAHLIAGKSLSSFDFSAVPTISPSRVRALASNDSWLKGGHNVIIFGPPGAGKSHLASAIGLALVEGGKRVMFTRTTDLVQKLQMAHRELRLESVLEKLNRYDLLWGSSGVRRERVRSVRTGSLNHFMRGCAKFPIFAGLRAESTARPVFCPSIFSPACPDSKGLWRLRSMDRVFRRRNLR